MRNTFPGCLEMIDGPCKYGHYHKGTSHLRSHIYCQLGTLRAPNLLYICRVHVEKSDMKESTFFFFLPGLIATLVMLLLCWLPADAINVQR